MKGEVQQVFIYIMVILVVGAVLLFGTKATISIMKKACDVDKVTFQTELKDLMEKGSDYGTIFDGKDGSIKAPCDYERLCILDAEAIEDYEVTGFNVNGPISFENENRLMASEVTAKTGNNVFLIKGKEVIPLFALDTIRINDIQNNKYVCINATGGSFYLRLEGIGKGAVEVSEGS